MVQVCRKSYGLRATVWKGENRLERREHDRHVEGVEIGHSAGVTAGRGRVRDSMLSQIRTPEPATPRAPAASRTIMQIVVSLVLLAAALFIILSERYDPNSKHWAFATVGTILGFWLRG